METVHEVKGSSVKSIKTYVALEMKHRLHLNLALDGGQWPISHPDVFKSPGN